MSRPLYGLFALGACACSTPAPLAPPMPPAPAERDAGASQGLPSDAAALTPEPEVEPGSYAAHLRARRDAGAFEPRVVFKSDAQASEFQHCAKDSDCAIAGNGCCHEGVGDPGIGIRKDKVDAFAKLNPCADGICSLVYIKRAPDMKVRCVEARCAYEGVY